MDCSIVIPTWNEKMWLPRLLESIIGHPLVNEIIVVDNNSSDQTVSIAKKYGCLIAHGGLPGFSRNIGARLAQSEIIVFIDADTIIPYSTLNRAIRVLSMKKSILYHCPLIPLSPNLFVRLCYWVMDWYFRLLDFTPFIQGVGSFIAVRKSAFLKSHGFCEHLKAGEDADFFRRVAHLGRVFYDTKAFVYVSSRRFSIENPIWFALKTMFWSILRLTPTKASVFNYCWRRYPDKLYNEEAMYLANSSYYNTIIR